VATGYPPFQAIGCSKTNCGSGSRGFFPIYKKEGRSFAAFRGFRETEEFEAIQQSAARFFAT
jgi:hypothetical protein